MSDATIRPLLEQVAAGEVSPEEAFEQLRRFDLDRTEPLPTGEEPLRRVVLTGRFLNVEMEVDSAITEAVAETGSGWTARRVKDTLHIEGPAFANSREARATNHRGKEVSARSLEDRGDCVLRMRVPAGVRLEGEVLAQRLVTNGIGGFRGYIVADHVRLR